MYVQVQFRCYNNILTSNKICIRYNMKVFKLSYYNEYKFEKQFFFPEKKNETLSVEKLNYYTPIIFLTNRNLILGENIVLITKLYLYIHQ